MAHDRSPSGSGHPLSRKNAVCPPLPMTRQEMQARGWDEVDIVFVTGDAYVDHPAFAAAILGRVLEAAGFRVGIVAQPDWRSCEAWKEFGRPRLFFAISAGNMDSMLNHYTANRKVRNDDAYSPGGRIGLRPDRATKAYCQRAREAYKGVPIIAGGVEASLRRFAHYDYWSDKVMRSIVLDAKADLVVCGMGEEPIVEIARRLQSGETLKDLRTMRGVVYACGASEAAPAGPDTITLPSFEEVVADKQVFAKATRMIHLETNPHNARTLVQYHDRQAIVCTPPSLPVSPQQMDHYYALPYTRRPHPSYREPIPALDIVKHSVTIMRGCFGGCTFCSLTLHQGRIIQWRSRESILDELEQLTREEGFTGVISDIGGPSANMYALECRDKETQQKCRRLSCLHPTICKRLKTDPAPLLDVMRSARRVKGVRKVLVASGVRMDLARSSREYIEELAAHHVGGYLSVAPEHADPTTLGLMRKCSIEDFEAFDKAFEAASARAGRKQSLSPYFIASHPGCDIDAMIRLAVYLKRRGCEPAQVQDFIPAPLDIATCMYYTGLDPMTGKEVYVARGQRERRMQRAILQWFKPENDALVREALIAAGRKDLIGDGPDALIPARPPKEARRGPRPISDRRPRREDRDDRSEAASTQGKPSTGYRPGRKTQRRRQRRR